MQVMFNKLNVECGTTCVTVVSIVVPMFAICTACVVQKYNDDLWNLSVPVIM
jgi:hypothetical protein